MSGIGFEVIFILVLLMANAVFAMAEIAMVSSRKTRLKARADAGDKNARLALEMANSPGRFFSTVQVGITLVGILAGAVGGAHIADNLAVVFVDWHLPVKVADYLAIFIVVGIITYLSVIIGEIVPKRLALGNPERVAAALARPMHVLARAVSPLITVLNASSEALLALFNIGKDAQPSVSEEEVRVLIDEGLHAGVFKKSEKEMVERVFELDDQSAEDLMTPAARLVWLSLDDPDEVNWRRIAESGYSHFPVFEKNRDAVAGIVSVKSLWANFSLNGGKEFKALMNPPVYVPVGMPSGKLIEEFRISGRKVALVVDEFGGLQGLVTVKDVMMAIVGDLPAKDGGDAPKAVLQPDGTWLIDALMEAGEMRQLLGITPFLPGEETGEFSTLGGFLINRLGTIPEKGEKTVWEGFCFEVALMERQRVARVLVRPVDPPPAIAGKS